MVILQLQLFMSRVEALLKLHQIEDAESSLFSIPKLHPLTSSCLQTKFFGMLSEAYSHFIHAQIEMALGRYVLKILASKVRLRNGFERVGIG